MIRERQSRQNGPLRHAPAGRLRGDATRLVRLVVLLVAGWIIFMGSIERTMGLPICCACTGFSCGFCVDDPPGVSGFITCAQYCDDLDLGCTGSQFGDGDSCSGGCNGAALFPTLTPSGSPTLTPSITPTLTPTSTPPPTETPSQTPSITYTMTASQTPTITPTATVTPTPPKCCQCPNPACGWPPTPGSTWCEPGCTFVDNAVCVEVGQCLSRTPTTTPTSTPTVTPTWTASSTMTPTNTSTVTPTLPMDIDPYKCYRIKQSAKYKKRVVTYIDQFEVKRTAVLKPALLCNPALPVDSSIRLADITPTPLAQMTPGLKQPKAHLLCYKIKQENDPTKQDRFDRIEGIKTRNRVEVHTESGVCCTSAKCDDGVCTQCGEKPCDYNSDCNQPSEQCSSIVESLETSTAVKPQLICIPSLKSEP